MCDLLPYSNVNISHLDVPCVYGGNQYVSFRVPTNQLETATLDGARKWIDSKQPIIKYVRETPTFIPLPHNQQVKLRTFANKTNISFLTEIEGTIKAQVPKSLGATVNTHTEQINNLNKELDRVKKLEESTVSTVTTESDFTTVEATSNGYFEDVKLEGKTLVNLAKQPTNNGVINNIYASISKVIYIKPSTQYTYVIQNNGSEEVSVYLNDQYCFAWKRIQVGANSTVIGTATSLGTINGDTWLSLGVAETVKQNLQVVLLEGDHTQNPPSGYIEGLKSVGQSTSEDGVDEIVVSSVKGDGNLIDGEFYKLTEHVAGVNCSCLAKNTTYTINFDIDVAGGLIGLISDKSEPEKTDFLISNWGVVGNTITFTTPQSFIEKEYTIIFRKTDIHLNMEGKKAILNKGTTLKPYVQHQSDKKRLLYYNEETQTWEKPILREWDSIEKHSDGKYYYHQRSGEVVLNGSEDSWRHVSESDSENIISFNMFLNVGGDFNTFIALSDKFNYKQGFGANADYENFFHANASYTQFRINKSKLSTQDVAGFKQWLQANNVTVVYKLAEEKVYECTNIDLITYANETNYVIESGAIVPKTTLKVHNNISNVVSLLQKKVSLLENKFIQGLKQVLAGDMYSLAELLYPEDFVSEEEPSDVPTLLI